MMEKAICVVFLVIALFISIPTCQQEKARWRGTAEEVDGVTVVKNPKEPVYTEDICIVDEELTIGKAEGSKEYMLSGVIDIAADNSGNIYAADRKENCIRVFDTNGRYVRTIGRSGQGPGEFDGRITRIRITPQNELMAYDWRAFKLTFFSFDGNYLRTVLLKGVQALRISRNTKGNYLVGTIEFQGQYGTNTFRSSMEVREHDSDFTIIKTLVKDKFRDANMPLHPEMLARIPSSDLIVCGFTDSYEFQIMDSEGEIVRKVLKEYDPIEISDDEKVKRGLAGEKNVPKYFPAFQDFSMDEEGRFFVQTFERQADGIKFLYDVFDTDGKYVAKIPLNALPQYWKKRKMYTIEEDVDGYQHIKRYNITLKI
jgi:hypothetical protein